VIFESLTEIYESLVDWPKRLAHEEPFYRRLFERIGARRLVDTACGTGHHAAGFHEWGLEVEAADVSREMIERAQSRFGEPPGLRWVVRGFEEPIDPATPFDAALCVGNSLALAPNVAAAERAVGQMLAAVRPGGAVVIQVLNLGRLPEGPCVWQKSLRTTTSQGEALVIKGIHRGAAGGFVDFLIVAPDGRLLHQESVPLLDLTADGLAAMARRAGAETIEFFGGYRGQLYNRPESADLVMIATR
jgi:glycine/sarcosine N-methyltransferase